MSNDAFKPFSQNPLDAIREFTLLDSARVRTKDGAQLTVPLTMGIVVLLICVRNKRAADLYGPRDDHLATTRGEGDLKVLEPMLIDVFNNFLDIERVLLQHGRQQVAADIERARDEVADQIKGWEERVAALTQELDTAKATAASTPKNIEEVTAPLQAEIAKLQEQLSQQARRAHSEQATAEQKEQALQAALQAQSSLQSQLATAQSRIQHLEQQLQSLPTPVPAPVSVSTPGSAPQAGSASTGSSAQLFSTEPADADQSEAERLAALQKLFG